MNIFSPSFNLNLDVIIRRQEVGNGYGITLFSEQELGRVLIVDPVEKAVMITTPVRYVSYKNISGNKSTTTRNLDIITIKGNQPVKKKIINRISTKLAFGKQGSVTTLDGRISITGVLENDNPKILEIGNLLTDIPISSAKWNVLMPFMANENNLSIVEGSLRNGGIRDKVPMLLYEQEATVAFADTVPGTEDTSNDRLQFRGGYIADYNNEYQDIVLGEFTRRTRQPNVGVLWRIV